MYRSLQNIPGDIQQVVDIYNATTGRSRTVSQHQWEWFESPNLNNAYVITKQNGEVIGHHGLLTIHFHYNNQRLTVGKTENTIVKKGFGAVYPRNERAMLSEYSAKYDLLITTAAQGSTQRMREAFGYKRFAKNVMFVKLLDFSILVDNVKNIVFKPAIKSVLKCFNVLLIWNNTQPQLVVKLKPLAQADLAAVAQYYDAHKASLGFTQERSSAFLAYRFINNPYGVFQIATFFEAEALKGYLIFQIYDGKLFIEDVLSDSVVGAQALITDFVKVVKMQKLAKIVIFVTLERSLLDQKYKGFYRRVFNNQAPCVMSYQKGSNQTLEHFNVKKLYFTRLTNEGIS